MVLDYWMIEFYNTVIEWTSFQVLLQFHFNFCRQINVFMKTIIKIIEKYCIYKRSVETLIPFKWLLETDWRYLQKINWLNEALVENMLKYFIQTSNFIRINRSLVNQLLQRIQEYSSNKNFVSKFESTHEKHYSS